MSATIDERVVQMRFDNDQFERGISQSVKSLDTLQKSLKLDDSAAGLENVTKAANNVNFDHMSRGLDQVSVKFNALNTIATAALTNITNKAVNAAQHLVKSITIDQVSAGMGKYETLSRSVQTILAATSDMGENIESVYAAMEKLNKYTDETSYDFASMAQSIGKFTTAGISLKDAENAMEGINNWAAVSGSTKQQANQAMYNIAQSMSAGYMKLIDWKSIQIAGMDTKEFRRYAIQAAAEVGTLVKKSDGQYYAGKEVVNEKTFTETLNKQWLNQDAMMKVFSWYADQTDGIGKKAFEAAKSYLTLTDVIDTWKDVVSTGWMHTFQNIFGTMDQAKKFWTTFGDNVLEIIQPVGDLRNRILELWNARGGRDEMIHGFYNLHEIIMRIIDIGTSAWDAVFTPFYEFDDLPHEGIGSYADDLVRMTQGFVDVTEAVMDALGIVNRFQAETVETTEDGVFGGEALAGVTGDSQGFTRLEAARNNFLDNIKTDKEARDRAVAEAKKYMAENKVSAEVQASVLRELNAGIFYESGDGKYYKVRNGVFSDQNGMKEEWDGVWAYLKGETDNDKQLLEKVNKARAQYEAAQKVLDEYTGQDQAHLQFLQSRADKKRAEYEQLAGTTEYTRAYAQSLVDEATDLREKISEHDTILSGLGDTSDPYYQKVAGQKRLLESQLRDIESTKQYRDATLSAYLDQAQRAITAKNQADAKAANTKGKSKSQIATLEKQAAEAKAEAMKAAVTAGEYAYSLGLLDELDSETRALYLEFLQNNVKDNVEAAKEAQKVGDTDSLNAVQEKIAQDNTVIQEILGSAGYQKDLLTATETELEAKRARMAQLEQLYNNPKTNRKKREKYQQEYNALAAEVAELESQKAVLEEEIAEQEREYEQTTISGNLQRIAKGVLSTFHIITSVIGTIGNIAASVITPLVAPIVTIVTGILAAAGDVISILDILLFQGGGLEQALSSIFGWLVPIGEGLAMLVSAGLQTFVGWLNQLKENGTLDELSAKISAWFAPIKAVFDYLKTVLSDKIAELPQKLAQLGQKLKAFFTSLSDSSFVKTLKSIGKALTKFVGTVLTVVATLPLFAISLLPKLWGKITKLFGKIKSEIEKSELVKKIQNFFKPLTDVIGKFADEFSKKIDSIKKTPEKLQKAIEAFMENPIKYLKSAATKLKTWIHETYNNVMKSLYGEDFDPETMTPPIIQGIINAWEGLKEYFKPVTDWFTSVMTDISDAIDWMNLSDEDKKGKTAPKLVQDIIKIWTDIQTFFNPLITWFNELKGNLSDAIEWLFMSDEDKKGKTAPKLIQDIIKIWTDIQTFFNPLITWFNGVKDSIIEIWNWLITPPDQRE